MRTRLLTVGTAGVAAALGIGTAVIPFDLDHPRTRPSLRASSRSSLRETRRSGRSWSRPKERSTGRVLIALSPSSSSTASWCGDTRCCGTNQLPDWLTSGVANGTIGNSETCCTSLGLKVAITEADARTFVNNATDQVPTDHLATFAQPDEFGQMLKACLAVRHCISFTIWGFGDADSWVPGFFTGEGYATIYDVNLNPKPAYTELHQDLRLAAFGAPHRVPSWAGL
jgi:Glycosyl hydrolase family 10